MNGRFSAQSLHLAVTLCVVLALPVVSAIAEAKPLLEPQEIAPTRKGNTKVNLSVRAHRVSLPLHSTGEKDADDLFFEYTGRFYFLEGKGEPLLPGPTLRAQPGGKIVLEVTNELGAESAGDFTMNSFHHANTTNVHFHGVHGNPAVDDPFTTITAGERLLYKLSLPRDHEPGMHWYHAHSHGSVYQQVMGGLFGAIVVGEGSWLVAPKHPFRSWDDTILMVHLYRLDRSQQCDGTTMDEVDRATGSSMPSKPKIVDRAGNERKRPAELYFVNGQHRPTVAVIQNRPMVLRMAFAAGSCHLNVTLPPQCDFHTFAVDGVQLRRTRASRWLYFTTATRIEVAVVCGATGMFPVHLSHDSEEVIFYLFSKKSKKKTMKVNFPVTIPKYSPDYLYLGSTRRVNRDISFSQQDVPASSSLYVIGQGENCSSLYNDSTCYYAPFGGKIGTNADNYHGFAVPLHAVITARIFGDPTDKTPHPLHFHVNHFQFLSFEPRRGGQHENLTMDMYGVVRHQFRDTIPILDGVTTIRWQAASYLGEVAYHCHGLHHEDRGMMQSYFVYPDWAPAPSGNSKHTSSSNSKRAMSAALFAMLLLSAVAALVIVGVRSYREHPNRNFDRYYVEREAGTEMSPQRPPRVATEVTPLMGRR